jgi:hypothetical protein
VTGGSPPVLDDSTLQGRAEIHRNIAGEASKRFPNPEGTLASFRALSAAVRTAFVP